MKSTQKSYQFSLVLKNVDEDTPKLEDSLYEAGCDDALINFRNGTVYLDFDRESSSFEEAVISAINDVESSSVQAIVASVAPEDLVTESEIAKRLGKDRQIISLWVQGKRRSSKPFPKPIMKLSDRSPFWKWREVIEWVVDNNLNEDKEKIAIAIFLEDINAALEERDTNRQRARQSLVERFENRAR